MLVLPWRVNNRRYFVVWCRRSAEIRQPPKASSAMESRARYTQDPSLIRHNRKDRTGTNFGGKDCFRVEYPRRCLRRILPSLDVVAEHRLNLRHTNRIYQPRGSGLWSIFSGRNWSDCYCDTCDRQSSIRLTLKLSACHATTGVDFLLPVRPHRRLQSTIRAPGQQEPVRLIGRRVTRGVARYSMTSDCLLIGIPSCPSCSRRFLPAFPARGLRCPGRANPDVSRCERSRRDYTQSMAALRSRHHPAALRREVRLHAALSSLAFPVGTRRLARKSLEIQPSLRIQSESSPPLSRPHKHHVDD